MTHDQIVGACESLGLTVKRVPAEGRMSFEATNPKGRVYWSTSTLGGLLGLPRVIYGNGIDIHARSVKEIRYLIQS